MLAQTQGSRKAEADRLLKQGIEQLNNDKDDAVDWFEKALAIYQDIKDRQGEGRTLAYLGKYYLGRTSSEAIKYNQIDEIDDIWLAISNQT